MSGRTMPTRTRTRNPRAMSEENLGSGLIASESARAVMTAAYAPLLLWGPLLAVATYAYQSRLAQRQLPETA
jgi:hypothetical protein